MSVYFGSLLSPFTVKHFSGIDGKLESERIVSASIQRGLYSWCHLGPPSSLPGVGATLDPLNSGTSLTDSSDCVPVEDWNVKLRDALHSPDIKIVVKGCSGCNEPSVVRTR
jgi:hypothetical protein